MAFTCIRDAYGTFSIFYALRLPFRDSQGSNGFAGLCEPRLLMPVPTCRWCDRVRKTTIGHTDIALALADHLSVKNRGAQRFEQLTLETLQLVNGIENVTGARVSLISKDFSHSAIIDRRIGW